MLLIWQDADDYVVHAELSRLKPDDNASSGDSCWVKQYLDWCDPPNANPMERAIGCRPDSELRILAA